MTEHLMNPVNRQYFILSNLMGHTDLIAAHGSEGGYRRFFFRESQPAFIRHPVISDNFGSTEIGQ